MIGDPQQQNFPMIAQRKPRTGVVLEETIVSLYDKELSIDGT